MNTLNEARVEPIRSRRPGHAVFVATVGAGVMPEDQLARVAVAIVDPLDLSEIERANAGRGVAALQILMLTRTVKLLKVGNVSLSCRR